MEALQRRVESWISDQRTKILKVAWPPPWPIAVKWPWPNGRRERQRKIQEELDRRKKQLQDLCYALKAETVSDLQEILCCMVLSECVYKRPTEEMIRAVNKFKADFGGQLVSLERVQPSADHVSHRYLLAEAGDTLFASFIGTKQYRDFMADANIFQGAIFHDNPMSDDCGNEPTKLDGHMGNGENDPARMETATKQTQFSPKPAAHRGFMARAKGIPALELYRLAQKKRRKLVLCGHSLGGAVAVLATLAILRVVAVTSKESDRVAVKCITFSQPPVGNAALRDYVNGKGWQHIFKTYCIPEDLVPRILSPAYFHHYNNIQIPMGPAGLEPSPSMSRYGTRLEKQKVEKSKESEGEQLVLGLGPVQNSFWRLSRLVPIEGLRRQISRFRGIKVDTIQTSAVSDSAATTSIDDMDTAQSLEIEEGSDGISLHLLPEKSEDSSVGVKNEKRLGYSRSSSGDTRAWRRMPSLPSYVPFGHLYLLGNSSVESLSGSEYSKQTSVRSVLAEVKERFQSHSMRSYRSRFQRIFDLYMNEFSFLGREQELQFPQLQKWLGITVAGTVELGHIVDTPTIRAATSLVPLGWTGVPGEKNGDHLKVDISGFGLHLCTLVQARVNGKWCSTTVESFPAPPAYSQQHEFQPEMQKMRIHVGAPLKHPPKHQIMKDNTVPAFLCIDCSLDKLNQNMSPELEERFIHPDGLRDFVVFCTTDFSSVSKEVHVRTRRVRLIGLEGAGKTSLLKAVLDQGGTTRTMNAETSPVDVELREGIAGGLLYSDSTGVNLQNLNMEASNFRDELWKGIRDLSQKIDLVILVHNLSHRIPRYGQSNALQAPALSLLIDEAKSLGIPWVLAITNKFSVSAHQQKAVVNSVLQAYQASPSLTEVINSCLYVMPSAAGDYPSWHATNIVPDRTAKDGQKLYFDPVNLVRKPFRKKPAVLPVEGVTALCQVVHRVLRSNEEAALQELTTDRIFFQLAKERAAAEDAVGVGAGKQGSVSAATVGASVGAGVGIILAVVMGAASVVRKP